MVRPYCLGTGLRGSKAFRFSATRRRPERAVRACTVRDYMFQVPALLVGAAQRAPVRSDGTRTQRSRARGFTDASPAQVFSMPQTSGRNPRKTVTTTRASKYSARSWCQQKPPPSRWQPPRAGPALTRVQVTALTTPLARDPWAFRHVSVRLNPPTDAHRRCRRCERTPRRLLANSLPAASPPRMAVGRPPTPAPLASAGVAEEDAPLPPPPRPLHTATTMKAPRRPPPPRAATRWCRRRWCSC